MSCSGSNDLSKLLGGIIGGMGGLTDDLNPKSQVDFNGGEYSIKGTYINDEDVQQRLDAKLQQEIEGGGNLGFAGQVDLPGEVESFTPPEDAFMAALQITGGDVSTGRFQSISGGVSKGVTGGVSNTAKQVCTKYTQHKSEIENNLSNLIVLKKFIDEGFNKLYSILSNCDSGVSTEVSSIKEVHDQVLKEVDNQINHLQNLLNVTVKPTHKDLSDALDKFTTFDKVAELLLPYEYGTSEASDRLAIAYTSVFQLKNVAKKVKKALDDAKISVSDYSNTKNINDLTNKLIKSMQSSKSVDLTNLIEAITILKNNFKDRTKITDFIKDPKKMDAQILSKKSGGAESDSDSDDEDDHAYGGAIDDSNLGRIKSDKSSTVLSKRVQKSTKTLKELFKLFVFDVTQKFDEIKKSVDVLSTSIGFEIEYNDNLVEFINTYEIMSDFSSYSLFYSLIGLNNTPTAKQDKQMFIDNLLLVSQSITPLLSQNKYSSYFKDIQNNINQLIITIDTYTDLLKESKSYINKKSGGVDENEIFPQNTLINDNVLVSSTSLIQETARKLKFYGNTIALKQNLKTASTQFKEYKQGYDELLGKTIGNKLSLINNDYVKIIKSIDSTDKDEDLGKQLNTYNLTATNKIDADLLKSMVKLQFDAKQDLYKTIEAIDLYLMNFTEQIQASPEDVSKIEKILNSVQIISKWFTQKSGDDLLTLFNSFPNASGTAPSDSPAADFIGDISKYIQPHKMKSILEKCKKSLEGISVLKNIIATFIYVGDMFGKTSIKESMFMSPNVIYKNLFKYLWVTAFNVQLYADKGNNFNLGMAIPNSDKTNDIFKTDDEYYVLTIKAMVAKVFSVIGTYSLLNDPVNIKNLVHNPTRLILGGASSEPEIIDNAIELYVRLPLLLEFYRSIFNNDNTKTDEDAINDNKESIAFIPEVGSVWSNIISLVFDKSKYIEKGIYTKANLNTMIEEINNIYRHYSKESNKDNIVRNVTNGLVFEINKRYGILKRKDIRNYYDLLKDYENPNTNLETELSNNLNFDILDADGEYELPAPSNKFTKSSYSTELLNYKRKMESDKNMVGEFRKRITKELNIADIDDKLPLSFKRYIKMYTQELKASKVNNQKYDIVLKAINNSNDSNINNKQYYILFHELVISPLNVLQYLHELTKTFVEKMSVTTLTSDTSDLIKKMEVLYNFTYNNNLVSLRHVSNTNLVIDYSKLQETVESVIMNIKYVLQKFKIIINKELIDKYEKYIYTLEIEFLNKLIQHKDNDKNKSLETVSVLLNDISKMIPGGVKSAVLDDYISYAKDIELAPGTVDLNRNLNQLEKDMYKTYTHSDRNWKPIDIKISNTSQKKGLVTIFNNIAEVYVNTLYDISNKKIYVKLLDNFNNAMQSILSSDKIGFNNTNVSTKISLNNEDIEMPVYNGKLNHVLGANITYIVKTLLQRTVNPQLDNKFHLLNDLQEVSPHMVEKYRAQLPILIKLFKSFITKCLFCKRLYVENISKPEDKTTISVTIDNIIECCSSLLKDANVVLTEVNTLDNNITPLFMELRQDFIRNYFNIVGETPFMPLSTLTYILNKDVNFSGKLIPSPQNTNYHIKYQYGIKNILNTDSDIKLNNIVYLKELHKTYNSSVNNSHVIDENNVNSLVQNNVQLLRYVNNTMYSNYLSVDNAFKLSPDYSKINVKTYYFDNTTGDKLPLLINSLENTVKSSSEINLFKSLSITEGGTELIETIDRKHARILNIIDLNIVPINIHALLREVPLINIYNYAYTYDSIISDTIIASSSVDDESSSVISTLYDTLINPLNLDINAANKKSYTAVLTKDIPQLNLFKPRFLQDQLYDRIIKVDNKGWRENTKLVKHLVFLCNIQRVLRSHIRAKLDNINTRVVDKIKITSNQITDYVGTHGEYDDNEFNVNY